MKECSSRDDFQRRGASCFERMLFCGLLFSEEIILFQKNPLSGMIFQRRMHPVSEECSPRDDFPQQKSSFFRRILSQGCYPQQKSSCFRGILSKGCFSTAECILFQRNPLPGIIFHRRMHPVSEESSPKDDFPKKKSSCFRGILSQGCFSSVESILIQGNIRSGMLP